MDELRVVENPLGVEHVEILVEELPDTHPLRPTGRHTGIDHVEVQVDGGEWTRAELGGVPSVDTWVQWAVTIDVPEGDHEVRVRATGKDGETQTSVVRSPDPDGATGWHAVEFSAG